MMKHNMTFDLSTNKRSGFSDWSRY